MLTQMIDTDSEALLPPADRVLLNKNPHRLTKADIQAMRIEVWHQIQRFQPAQLLLMMGTINAHVYGLGIRWGAIVEKEEFTELGVKSDRSVDPDQARIMASGCIEKKATLTVAVTWLRKYLNIFWKGACNSCPTIRKIRRFMRDDLRLFDFEDQLAGTTVAPPDIQNIDLIKMLLVYEACEIEFLSRQYLPEGAEVGTELETFLPKHKGAIVVSIFNAVFEGVAQYRRVHDEDINQDEAELPDAPDVPEFQVTWQWQHWMAIGRRIWNNLIKKNSRITGRQYNVDESEPVNWDAVAEKCDEWMQQQQSQWEIPY